MLMLHRFAAALVLAGVLAPPVLAQTPTAAEPPAPTRDAQARSARSRPADLPPPSTYDTRAGATTPGDRSVLRSARNYRHETYGWRNPGGVGRSAEYYPPGNRFQNPGSPMPAATFNQQTYALSRSAQMRAYQIGNQRNAVLQQHIDRYGRPLGFGFGFGLGGGAFGFFR